MKHIHTIYIPDGMTTKEVWKELCIFGHLVTQPTTNRGDWTNVNCDGEECRLIERADDVAPQPMKSGEE